MNASERLLANHQIDHSCSRGQFPLLTPEAIKALISPEAIWAGILLATGFSLLYGVPGCGKTFFALNLAAHVALGWVFYGRKTLRCRRVVYVAQEGLSGLKERIMAWEDYYCTPYPADVRFMIQPFSLGSEQDVSLLVHQITRCGGADLVIVDTLARVATGMDENSARDMTKVLAGISALQQSLSAHVMVLHHPAKSQARQMRGSSVFLGAADTVVLLARKDRADRKWVVEKSRDGQEGISGHFRLETIDLGESTEGDAITSCVAVPCAGSHALPDTTLLPRGTNQRSVFQAITALLTQQQLDRTNGVCQDEPGILFEDVGTVCDSALSHIADKHRKTRFKEALDGLIAGGFLSLNDNRIKLASD